MTAKIIAQIRPLGLFGRNQLGPAVCSLSAQSRSFVRGPASSKASEVDGNQAVGLSLFFQNSQMPAFTLFGNHPRYLSEVDIAASTPPVATDTGIQSLIAQSEFSSLDWTGVQMVEENWAPPEDGTYTRQRFYRGANWMKNASFFRVFREKRPRPNHRRAPVGHRWH